VVPQAEVVAMHGEDAVLHREPLRGTAEARGRHEHRQVRPEVHLGTQQIA
jgi:hypothetical protein